MFDLVIVIPTYNEQACIEQVAGSWLKVLAGRRGRLIIIDDGSRDQTGALLDQLASHEPNLQVIHQKNAGHGAAVLRGYHEALALAPEFVFQTDSDNQFDPADFDKLWNAREQADFITGVRAERHDPLHRLVINRIMRSIVFALFGVWLLDPNIPYRLIRGTTLRKLLDALPASLFAPNIFLTILAARSGSRLLELPVKHLPRTTGTVSIMRLKLLKVCVRSAGELLTFRQNIGRSAASSK